MASVAAGKEVAYVVNKCNEAKEDLNLDLSNCNLTMIPDAVFLLMKYTEVSFCSLAGNFLKKIPVKFMNVFTFLSELNLSSNKLTSLPDEVTNLDKLKHLDLSHNCLETLPSQVYQMTELVKLNLEGNQIKELDVQQIEAMVKLKEINLKGNPLTMEVYTSLVNSPRPINIHLTPQDPRFDAID